PLSTGLWIPWDGQTQDPRGRHPVLRQQSCIVLSLSSGPHQPTRTPSARLKTLPASLPHLTSDPAPKSQFASTQETCV
uniref:Uncharacterized protein n=1 Tax=Geospiza parvula TaxID=87175 RepID=A0A8C3N2P1_GEOPR